MNRPIYDLCVEYAEGDLSHEDLVLMLVNHDYPQRGDDTETDPPGAWVEVVQALADGLIDADLYAEVWTLLHPFLET